MREKGHEILEFKRETLLMTVYLINTRPTNLSIQKGH
jgi:hypothetical protein